MAEVNLAEVEEAHEEEEVVAEVVVEVRVEEEDTPNKCMSQEINNKCNMVTVVNNNIKILTIKNTMTTEMSNIIRKIPTMMIIQGSYQKLSI